MKKNELRTGNWVKIPIKPEEIIIPNFETQVQGIGIFGGIEFLSTPKKKGVVWSVKSIIGILLTKQWLKDFGFEKMEHYGIVFYIEIKNGYLIVDLKTNTFSVSNSLSEFRKGEYFEMKNRHEFFVHLLQNLYFELNEGEEELKKA